MILQRIILLSVFLLNDIPVISGITNQFSRNKHFRRHSSIAPTTDWEPGLREATYQALRREQYAHPDLHDQILEAPVYGRQESAIPFGDITVLARGQLYSTLAGFKFVQEPYPNDCDDCNSGAVRCRRLKCITWRPNQGEDIIALWTIKRIRHRDPYYGHRYELQYTVAPISETVNKAFILPNGAFDYHIPGHVFIIKSDPNETKLNNHKTEESKILHNYHTISTKNNYRPELLIGLSPDGYRYSSPAPPQHSEINFPKIQQPREEIKEIEIYKALVDTLSLKTSTSAESPTPNNIYPEIFDLKTATINKIDSTTLPQLIFETEGPRFPTTKTPNKHFITNAFPDIFDLTITKPVRVTETTSPQIILETTLPVTKITHALTQPSTKITTHVFDLNIPTQIPATQETRKTVTPQFFTETQRPTTKPFIKPTLTTFKPARQSTPIKTIYVPQKTTAHQTSYTTTYKDTEKQQTTNKYSHQSSTSQKTAKTPLTTITFFTPVEIETKNEISVSPNPATTSTTKQFYSAADDIFSEPKEIPQTESTKDQLQRPDKETETTVPYLYTTATNILPTRSSLNNVKLSTSAGIIRTTQSISSKKLNTGKTFDKHKTHTTTEDSENSENVSSSNYREDILTTIMATTDQSYKANNADETIAGIATTEATTLEKSKINDLRAVAATTEYTSRETSLRTVQPLGSTLNYINEKELSTTADFNENVGEESTVPIKVTTFATHLSTPIKKFTTQKIVTAATTQKQLPQKSKTVNKIQEQKILSDIFGDDSVQEKPQVIEKPLLSALGNKPSDDEQDFLFGSTTPHTVSQQTKVIYEDFFEASTMKPTIENTPFETEQRLSTDTTEAKSTPAMKNEPVPRTSMSYITSISFEVNKKDPSKNLQKPMKPAAMIKAEISEMNTSDYQIFKAEMPDDKSEMLNTSVTKEFDKIALTLVNHARTISILNNKTETRRPKRRRTYIPKKDRRQSKKEDSTK